MRESEPVTPLLPKETPISPTTSGRIQALDLARGVAVLGILLANIHSFGTPTAHEMMSGSSHPTVGFDRVFEMLSLAFVNGKFRAMLAMLFGAGLFLQYQKRSKIEGNWPGGYLKRSLFLLLIGLIHGFLIWFGDILGLYSMVSFGACLLATATESVRKKVFFGLLGLNLLVAFAFIAVMLAMAAFPNALGSPSGNSLFANETAIFSSGTYIQQLGIRALMYGSGLASGIFLLPLLTCLFMFGSDLARNGVFEAGEEHREAIRKLLVIGLGVGLPASMLVWFGWNAKNVLPLQMIPELLTGPILAAGYLGVVLAWSRSGFLRPIQKLFTNVGRLALTNYLMQSILCTTIFYSWGFGLFGKLDAKGLLMVVGGVWIVCIVFSALYLRKFSIGPVEWLWRRMTEGRPIPIRATESGA